MNQEMSRGEHHMLAEIEVVPFTREGEDTSFVNKAIALIRESKLKHEVNALGTTIEGIRNGSLKAMVSNAVPRFPRSSVATIARSSQQLREEWSSESVHKHQGLRKYKVRPFRYD